MKKLLLILCLGCMANLSKAQDATYQSVQDSHHKVLGYIKGGTITDAKNNFLGEFKSGNNGSSVITDKNHNTIGYLIQSKIIQDANHKMLGNINTQKGSNICTVSDGEGKTLGLINMENGAIQDINHSIIGYEISTELMWAAPYFFFFKF